MTAANFDIKQAHVATTLTHGAPLIACRFHPSGTTAFATSEDGSLQRFDLAGTGKVAYLGHESWPFSLNFIDQGKTVISTAGDGRLIWWSATDAKPTPQRTIQAHSGWARCSAVSPDEKIIATGGNDNLVKLWSAIDGQALATLSGHANRVYSLHFHPDGKHLLSGDLMGSVRIWELASTKEIGALDAKELHTYEPGQGVDFGGVRGLTLNPGATQVATGGLYKASNPLGAVHEPIVVTFDWATRKKLRTQIAPGIPGGVLWRLKYLSDQTLIGVCGGTSGGFLLFWKPDQEKDAHRLQLPNIARDLDLHPTQPMVATAHHDGKLRLSRLAAKV